MRPGVLMVGMAILMATVSVSAEEPQPKTAPSAPKLICKSDLATGSLVSRKKRCFSAKDWQRISEAAQLGAREMQERNSGIPAGGT